MNLKKILKIDNLVKKIPYQNFKNTIFIWMDEFEAGYLFRVTNFKVKVEKANSNFGGRERIEVSDDEAKILDKANVIDSEKDSEEILKDIYVFLSKSQEDLFKRINVVYKI